MNLKTVITIYGQLIFRMETKLTALVVCRRNDAQCHNQNPASEDSLSHHRPTHYFFNEIKYII